MARQKKAAKKQAQDLVSILNNPSEKEKLQVFIDEAVAAKTRMADEAESVKALREDAQEKIGISGKDFNKLVKMYFKNDFAEAQTEIEKWEAVLSLLLSNSSRRTGTND